MERIWFFGSRVRGFGKDGKPIRDDSDLDIAVQIDVEKFGDGDPLEECASTAAWMRVADTWCNELASLSRWAIDLQMHNDDEHVKAYVSECSELIDERGTA